MHNQSRHIGFWNYAREFYCAAQKLHQDDNDINIVVYYLYCHSIEVVLKAVLNFKGYSEKNLKKIGHDLIKVWNKAKTSEPNLGDMVSDLEKLEDVLKLLNPYYKGKEFEYIREGYKRFPLLKDVSVVVNDLLLNVGKVISIPYAQLKRPC